MNLKDCAVYRLPNGRELVAHRTCDNETVLVNISASDSGIYKLNPDGRLLCDGQLTAWQIDDLAETGRAADSEILSRLVDLSTPGLETTNEQAI